jgi:hypothetical protein
VCVRRETAWHWKSRRPWYGLRMRYAERDWLWRRRFEVGPWSRSQEGCNVTLSGCCYLYYSSFSPGPTRVAWEPSWKQCSLFRGGGAWQRWSLVCSASIAWRRNVRWTYRMIKKSLCTGWLQYRKLQVMFKVSPASLQTFIDTPGGH